MKIIQKTTLRVVSLFLLLVFLLGCSVFFSSCAGPNTNPASSPSSSLSTADAGVLPSSSADSAASAQMQTSEELTLPNGSALSFLQGSYEGYFVDSAESLSPGTVFFREDFGNVFYLAAEDGVYSIIEQQPTFGTANILFQSQTTDKINGFIPLWEEKKLALFIEETVTKPENVQYKMNRLYFYDLNSYTFAPPLTAEAYGVEEKYCIDASYSEDSLYLFASDEAGQYVNGNAYHIASDKASLLAMPSVNQQDVFLCGNQVFYVKDAIVYLASGEGEEPVPLVKLGEGLLPYIYFYEGALLLVSDKAPNSSERYIMQVSLQEKKLLHCAKMEFDFVHNPWKEVIKITDENRYLLMRDEYLDFPNDLTLDHTTFYQYDFDGNLVSTFPEIAGDEAPILADCQTHEDILYYTDWSLEGEVSLRMLDPLE